MIPGVLTQGVMNPQVRGLADIAPLAPELLVVLGAFALLMLDLFLDERRRFVTLFGAIIVLLAAACLVAAGVGGPGPVMHDMFVRKSVGLGKSLSVRLDCGGRLFIIKKYNT